MSPIPPFSPAPLPGQAGNSGKYLTTNGSSASWATVSGGDNTYDAIVASSGGDYTTLTAALAAASNGWRILVLDSPTEPATVTSSLTNLYITGVSRQSTIVDLTGGSYSFVLSGANCVVEHLGFNLGSGTGKVQMSGADVLLFDIYITGTGVPSTTLDVSSTRGKVIGLWFSSGYTGATGSNPFVYMSGTGSVLTDSYIEAYANGTTVTTAILRAQASPVFVSNVYISVISNASNAYGMYLSGIGSIAHGVNVIQTLTTAMIMMATASTNGKIIGCYVDGGNLGLDIQGSSCEIIGNIAALQSNSGTPKGISVTSNNNSITGNVVKHSGTLSGSGIYVSAGDDNVISSNRVSNFTNGINMVASTADRNIVEGNNVVGNTVAILDSGTDTHIGINTGISILLQKNLVYMKNTSGATINAGNVVTLKAVAAGDEVTTTTTQGDDKVFGMATANISNNAYGYIQVTGKTTLLTVNGTIDIAVGDFLGTYTAAGIAMKAAAGDMCFAMALEAYTGDDSNGVIDCLLFDPRLI